MRPIISIIIPVYNVERFLRICLDSILAQSFNDWEAILVDDGGKDNSGAICDEYCRNDKRFRVFHRENQGVSASRNFGIKQANGDYLCFVDSDDYIHQRMLEVLYRKLNGSKYDVAMSHEEDVYDTDSSRAAEVMDEQSELTIVNAKDFLYGVTHSEGKEKNLYFHLHGKLYKKEAIEGILLDEDISLSEDMLFNVKVFSRGVSALSIPITMYFRTLLREDSLSVNVKDTLILNTEVFLRALQYVPSKYRSMFVEHIAKRAVSIRGRDCFTSSKSNHKYKGYVLEYFNYNTFSFRERLKIIILYFIPFLTALRMQMGNKNK